MRNCADTYVAQQYVIDIKLYIVNEYMYNEKWGKIEQSLSPNVKSKMI